MHIQISRTSSCGIASPCYAASTNVVSCLLVSYSLLPKDSLNAAQMLPLSKPLSIITAYLVNIITISYSKLISTATAMLLKRTILPLAQVGEWPCEQWKEDIEFARQRLAGLNPVEISVCRSIPKGFHVTDAHVSHILPSGLTIEEACLRGKLFILDYRVLEPFATDVDFDGSRRSSRGEHIVDGEKRWVTAPFCLLFASDDFPMVPIAIQL